MKASLDAIWSGSAQQAIFRDLLWAMSRPGEVVHLQELCGDHRPLVGVLATLVDGTVSLADPDALIDERCWPLLEARRSSSSSSDYVVADGRKAPAVDFEPSLGTLADPDRSSTMVLEVDQISSERGEEALELSGPGIQTTSRVTVTGFDRSWLKRRASWVEHFPLGVDFFITDKRNVVALPRTTSVAFR